MGKLKINLYVFQTKKVKKNFRQCHHCQKTLHFKIFERNQKLFSAENFIFFDLVLQKGLVKLEAVGKFIKIKEMYIFGGGA